MAARILSAWKTILISLVCLQFLVFLMFYGGKRLGPRLSRLFDVQISTYPRHKDTIVELNQSEPLLTAPRQQGLYLGFDFREVSMTSFPGKGARCNVSIAIGLGLSTRQFDKAMAEKMKKRKKKHNKKWKKIKPMSFGNMPFFASLLPTFCGTASEGYDYHFYVGYDYDDKYMNQEWFIERFKQRFLNITRSACGRSRAEGYYALHLIRCTHTGRPAWAQNDAMMAAYLDGRDYFYRVNDDTVMVTPHWTPAFIRALDAMSPPRVGVVGPDHHGGLENILTYDFVHRTHVEVFGFYYPRCYTDWYADGWITGVYAPGRVRKLSSVVLNHTLGFGTRYSVHVLGVEERNERIASGRETVMRYVTGMDQNRLAVPSRRAVAMTLSTNANGSTWGAIRNAQLVPVLLPGWQLNLYMTSRIVPTIPCNIIDALRRLNVRIYNISERDNSGLIPVNLPHYLVADDPSVDYFLMRSPESRITDRDAAAVRDWLRRNTTFHCMRDHPATKREALIGSLWAADAKRLRQLLNVSMETLLRRDRTSSSRTWTYSEYERYFLRKYIWPKARDNVFYHDSVNCKQTDTQDVFPIAAKGTEYVGMKHTVYEQPIPVSSETESVLLRERCHAILSDVTEEYMVKRS